MRRLELLSPAKNKEVAFTAIRSGADAVYIGGPAFGARKAVGNSLEEVQAVVEFAHRFYCRVFVTLNTLLYEQELQEVERLVKAYYHMGVDAVILQDPALLQLDLPPIALHASTQMHNYDLERIRFLDRLGIQRIVLARELSLEQLREIRREVKAELEYFVHGALCVSLSGQCYLSHYLMGRSANRGECAQPCRMRWTVEDADGKVLLKDKHVLSLKDLNLSSRLADLVNVGIDSFKIEGRLKDASYVANVTNYYSNLLNAIIERQGNCKRVGSGSVKAAFEADPERSFNRGYSTYFFDGRPKGLVNLDTPKSMGKRVGYALRSNGNQLLVESKYPIHNADGLCYLERGELKGFKVNRVENNLLYCNERVNITRGTLLYRNYDHEFERELENGVCRKIEVTMKVREVNGRLMIQVTDEDDVHVTLTSEEIFEEARDPYQWDRMWQQLQKCGDTIFSCKLVVYESEKILFVPSALLNAFRRRLLELLLEERERQRERLRQEPLQRDVLYTGEINWHLNVVNPQAEAFYQAHGVKVVEPGFEVNEDRQGKAVMTTRYCLLHELGRCRKKGEDRGLKYPLLLSNSLGSFQLEFDCKHCFMQIIALK